MTTDTKKLSMLQVLICGATIVTLSMGIRHGFGLWLQPITQAQGWTREGMKDDVEVWFSLRRTA